MVSLIFHRRKLKHKEVKKVRLPWPQNCALDHYPIFQQWKGSQGSIKTHQIWQKKITGAIQESSFECGRIKSQVLRG